MRISRSAPWFAAALLALSVFTMCGRAENRAELSPTVTAGLGDLKPPPPPPSAREGLQFGEADTLKLTLADLRRGPTVMLRNPADSTKVTVLVEDSLESAPLSQLLAPPAAGVVLRAGTPQRPSRTVLRLTAAGDTARAREGAYPGYLVAQDSAGAELARRPVIVTIPPPPSVTASASTWTTEVFKFALVPWWRARYNENAEMRCAPDRRRAEERGMLSRSGITLLGPCIRDNTLPVAVADTGKFRMGDRILLGVLQQKDSVDRALVWWNGWPVAQPGKAAGVELDFTSLDQPGEYRGTVDLATIGGTGKVDLRVRVTHDWPYVVLAILFGVLLSTWLRRYVRTRRAVLELEESRAAYVARIEEADLAFRALDRPRDGKIPYEVEAALLGELQRLEHRIRRHSRDGTPLEPGNEENERLRASLDGCEKSLVAWERFLRLLQGLREDVDRGNELALRLRPDLPERVALFDRAEAHFGGKPLSTEELAAVHAAVHATSRLVKSWLEVGDCALSLRQSGAHRGAAADAAAAGDKLDLAVLALFAAADAEALDKVADELNRIELHASGGRPSLGQRMINTVLRRPATPAPQSAAEAEAEEAREREEAEVRLVKRQVGSVGVPIPFMKGERMVWAWGVVSSTDPGERERRATQGRQLSDLLYFGVTTMVAVLTGFNELYLDAFGFGTMQDYLVAVLWGFGAKLGIDTVRAAIESRSLPWPVGRQGAQVPGTTAQTGGTAPTPTQPTPGGAAPNPTTPGGAAPTPTQPGGAAPQPAGENGKVPVGAGAGAGGSKPQVPPPDNPDGSSG